MTETKIPDVITVTHNDVLIDGVSIPWPIAHGGVKVDANTSDSLFAEVTVKFLANKAEVLARPVRDSLD